MKKDRTVLIAVSVFVIALFLQYTIIFTSLSDTTSTRDISAKVPWVRTANIQFCVNHQPSMVFECNSTAFVDVTNYTCYLNGTDIESENFWYWAEFDCNMTSLNCTNETKLFDIQPNGWINFTPTIYQVGNSSTRLHVDDTSGCSNGGVSDFLELEIININDPPYLIENIPNQTWEHDTNFVDAFDLDDYFFDPDLDNLTYTRVSSPLDNIEVTINAITNRVSFYPLAAWNGSEYIMFKAWDPYYANGTSNNITLMVKYIPDEDEPENLAVSSGGSGGGGSGSSLSCIPRWYCRPWSLCMPDNLIYRDCYDLNNCSSTFGIPNTTQPCEFESTCYDGIKGPGEEGIDCGGICPACGTCYDNLCNNLEDCTSNLIETPDCGGPCKPCVYLQETCFDGLCNNAEDCTKGLTEIPDCGGPCDKCPVLEQPLRTKIINWSLIILFLILLVLGYTSRKSYPYLLALMKKRKKKMYEERLMLETKITESILDNLHKIEAMIDNHEALEKIITLFSMLVRRYFKSLFELGYEFTYQEIMKELKLVNISPTFKSVLKNFFERSLEIEFSGNSSSYQEMTAMVSEFKHILSLTSKEPLKTNEKEIKAKLKSTKVDKMFINITNAESNSRKMELNKAFDIYLKLRKDFENLEFKDKQKLYDFISRLYEEIKLAREKFDYETS